MYVYRSIIAALTVGHLDQSTHVHPSCSSGYSKGIPADRDTFRFLFNINGKEQHLRFTRVPFGGESSPFLLGATLNYHYDQQSKESQEIVQGLRENVYIDNLMQTREEVEELEKFKREATSILESAKFPVHKWESDVEYLEREDSTKDSWDSMGQEG